MLSIKLDEKKCMAKSLTYELGGSGVNFISSRHFTCQKLSPKKES